MSEFEKVKEIIKENYEYASCGLFFSRNIVGDRMATIFKGERITVDICRYWEYFEVFGLNEEEKEELGKIYSDMRGY